MKIETAMISYEYVLVFDKEGNEYYLTMDDLKEILNSVKLIKFKKRVRSYIKLFT